MADVGIGTNGDHLVGGVSVEKWFAEHLAETRGLQPTMAPAMRSLVKDVEITFADVVAAMAFGYAKGRRDFL